MEIINLHDVSRVIKIKKQIYEDENCLKFKSLFKNQGNQGIVGIFYINKQDECVFKISSTGESVLMHEEIVLKNLYNLSSFCPNFPVYIDMIEKQVDSNYYNRPDPFQVNSLRKPRKKIKVLLSEYIKSVKLARLIADKRVHDNMIYSCIKQVVFSMYIGQQSSKQLTHYDLHSSNVIVKNCDDNIVFVYIFKNERGEERWECVPSAGMCSVIIDYGYSYVKDIENKPLYSTMEYTELGYTSNCFDSVVDLQRFLISISIDLKMHRTGNKLRKKIKKIYKGVDFDSGWEPHKNCRAKINKIFKYDKNNIHNKKKSIIFSYRNRFIESLQNLIDLPLSFDSKEKKKNIIKDTKLAFIGFLKEWNKIEKEIRNEDDKISIMEGIIISVRKVKKMYESKSGNIKEAIRIFRQNVYHEIGKVIDLCSPQHIEFELFLCSIILLSRGICYILKKESKKIQSDRAFFRKDRNLNILNIYDTIKKQIPVNYTFNINTTFTIVDSIREKCYYYKCASDEDVQSLNSADDICLSLRHILINGNI